MLSPFGQYSATTLLGVFLVIVISSLPLYFAVKVLGGKAGLLKVFLVNIIIAIVIPLILGYFGFSGGIVAGIISFLLMLAVYVIFFKIGFIRALLAWLLQLVFIFLLLWLLAFFGLMTLVV
jgi:hypothetical protein